MNYKKKLTFVSSSLNTAPDCILWREGFKGVFVVYAPRIASPRVTATKIFLFLSIGKRGHIQHLSRL